MISVQRDKATRSAPKKIVSQSEADAMYDTLLLPLLLTNN
jgi:hypothetical protein